MTMSPEQREFRKKLRALKAKLERRNSAYRQHRAMEQFYLQQIGKLGHEIAMLETQVRKYE